MNESDEVPKLNQDLLRCLAPDQVIDPRVEDHGIARRLYRPIPRVSSTPSRTSERIFFVLDIGSVRFLSGRLNGLLRPFLGVHALHEEPHEQQSLPEGGGSHGEGGQILSQW